MVDSLHIGMLVPSLDSASASNGIVTYVRIMRQALLDAGHRVTVFDGDDVLHWDGRNETTPLRGALARKLAGFIERWRREPFDPVRGYPSLRHQIAYLHAKDPFDIIEMEESFGWSRHMAIAVPIVVRLHGPHFLGKDDHEAPGAARASIRRMDAEARAIATADAITSPSARLLAATEARHAPQTPLVAVIPNPIDAATNANRWHHQACNPKQLLCIGRFDLRKGADIVLAAFAIAADRHAGLRLVMAGPDPGIADAKGRRTHFDDYCAAHVPFVLRERIRFLGPVPAAQVAALRLQSALCLVASRFENFPYSIAEAMAVGSPSIVSDSFGNAELVKHGETGLVVPVGDAQAMADAILSVIDDPARLTAMGNAGYARAADWLDPALVAAETIEFYRKAIARFNPEAL